MAKLELKFHLDNEAFSDEGGGDRDFAIAAVLKDLGERLWSGDLDLEFGDNVFDANGNVVGWITITEES